MFAYLGGLAVELHALCDTHCSGIDGWPDRVAMIHFHPDRRLAHRSACSPFRRKVLVMCNVEASIDRSGEVESVDQLL